MKNKIIFIGEKKCKVFGFSDEQIIFSTKTHKTFESLLAASQKSSLLESVKTIQFDSIKNLSYNEKTKVFKINYEKNNKIKKYTVLLSSISNSDGLVSEIANLKEFQKEIVDESKTQPLLTNILGVIMVSFFTWGLRRMAVDAQNGHSYEATGRRSGLKNLLTDGVEAIGPNGVSIIGVLLLIYIIYRTYKRYKNPASEIKYS